MFSFQGVRTFLLYTVAIILSQYQTLSPVSTNGTIVQTVDSRTYHKSALTSIGRSLLNTSSKGMSTQASTRKLHVTSYKVIIASSHQHKHLLFLVFISTPSPIINFLGQS